MPPLKFEPPPPARFGPSVRDIPQEARTELIARTGEWAIIWTGTNSTAYNVARTIRTSQGNWAGHTWEAVTRRNPDHKTAKVYARHIAPTQEN